MDREAWFLNTRYEIEIIGHASRRLGLGLNAESVNVLVYQKSHTKKEKNCNTVSPPKCYRQSRKISWLMYWKPLTVQGAWRWMHYFHPNSATGQQVQSMLPLYWNPVEPQWNRSWQPLKISGTEARLFSPQHSLKREVSNWQKIVQDWWVQWQLLKRSSYLADFERVCMMVKQDNLDRKLALKQNK